MNIKLLKSYYWKTIHNLNTFKNINLKFASEIEGGIKNNSLRTYWFNQKRNFGDLITPLLIRHYGYTPINGKIDKARIISTGSNIQLLQKDFQGIILGGGLIYEKEMRFHSAEIRLLRGSKTKECLGIKGNIPLGDPGLLASDFVKPGKQLYTLGIIPHYTDKRNPFITLLKSKYPADISIIDVQDRPTSVFQKISECEFILSSSLHGLVVADSFNIPNAWVKLSNNVIGDGFKFNDYRSVYMEDISPIKFADNDKLSSLIKTTNARCQDLTEELQHGIRSEFDSYFSSLRGT